ncbi:MAG: cadherin-like beta sandwich domain-containing protein, partial [Clostridium sp.]|nr:cadherin-like beta sandwich domain-containing protein [Clostridium sp.]
ELSSLKIKSTNGDTLDLKDGYNGETVKLSEDKEYYAKLTDDSEGIKINAEAKDEDCVVRIFLSKDKDATPYKSGDTITLGKGNTTIYVRTYESLSDFRKAKDTDKDVTNCAEEYTINVKKTKGSSYDDDTQDSIYLSNISINKGSMTFVKQRTSYDIKVASTVDELKITAKPEDSDDRVRINGSLVDESDDYKKTISLKKGDNEIKIKITDSKDNQRTYTLNVTRGTSSSDEQDEIYLSTLETSEGDIDFSSEDTSYSLDVDNDVKKLEVTAEPEDDEYLVTINGDEVNSGDEYAKKVSLNEGENKIKVIVEDEVNDKKRVYTLTVNRAKSEGSDESAEVVEDNKTEEDKNNTTSSTADSKQESSASKGGWQKVNDKWYLLDENGAKLTGWQSTNGTWYYLNEDGSMQTGWLKVEKTVASSSTSESKTETETTAEQSTKKQVTWYYFNTDGTMYTGWLDAGSWYYFNKDGAMQTGWLIDANSKYYLNEDGSMQTETKTIDGKTYKFSKSGAVII